MFTTVKVQTLINEIREALILEYGNDFLKASEKDQILLIYKAWTDSRIED